MTGLLTHFKRILTLSTRPSDVLSINPTQIHSLNLDNALKVAAGPNRFRDQVILDIGAHHGETLRRFSSLFPHAQIHCFEPFPQAFNVLQRVAAGLGREACAHPFGFSNEDSQKEFHINTGSPTNSLLPLHSCASQTWQLDMQELTTESCKFRTLDSWLQEVNLPEVALLKIDVQGAEYLVLEGAQRSFEKHRFKNVLIELINGQTYEGQMPISHYFHFFEKNGMILRGIHDMAFDKHGAILQMDLLFSIPEAS